MKLSEATTALAALAQDTRLHVFRLLVQQGAAGLAAGEVASALAVAPATLSFHLKELAHAGLVRTRHEGRYIDYSADFAAMNDLLAFLTENCCSGDRRQCAPKSTVALLRRAPRPRAREAAARSLRRHLGPRLEPVRRPMNVLFLCTGNSCRSILAEATFNHLAPAGWRAMSVGSHPTGQVHPRSLALLAREGIATEGLASKSWDALPLAPEIAITVCASAAGETCPAYLGPAARSHWGVDDPAHATGTDAEIDAAFERAYRILRARIEAFLALPLDELTGDRERLQCELDRIGSLLP